MKGQARGTRRLARVAAIVVALALLAIEAGAAGNDNDAATGVDAGETPETAARLYWTGPYQGNLTPGDAADWYKWKLGGLRIDDPVCAKVTLTATPSVQATFVAVANDDITREASTTVLLTRASTIGIAAPSLQGAFLNVSPSQPTQATYQFTAGLMSAAALPPGDAGTGADAPPSATGAFPLGGRACLGGRLHGAAGDAADAYSLNGQAGQSVLVSLADTAGRATATLADANGNVLGSVASGSVAQLDLPATGSYTLTVFGNFPSPTSYVMGMCDPDCGPPARPCRPMCAFVLGTDE